MSRGERCGWNKDGGEVEVIWRDGGVEGLEGKWRDGMIERVDEWWMISGGVEGVDGRC